MKSKTITLNGKRTTLRVVRVGVNHGWVGEMVRGGKVIAETDVRAFPEAAMDAIERKAAR